MDINKLSELKHHFLTVTKLPKADRILDLGAGEGLFQYKYPHTDAEIWKVDKISSEYDRFTLCQMMYPENCVVTDAWKLDMFEDDFFDMVIFNEIIEHLPEEELKMTVKEIKRVLKKDGLLQVATPNIVTRKVVGKYMANEFHIKEYSYEEMLEWFKENDFEIVIEDGQLSIDENKGMHMNFNQEHPSTAYVMWFLVKNNK